MTFLVGEIYHLGGGDLGCIFDGEMHAEISEGSLFNALGVSLVAHDIMNPL